MAKKEEFKDDFVDETVIEEKKEDKKKKTKTKVSETVETIQYKIYLVFSLFSGLLNKENTYTEVDFKVEANCLLELMKQYEIVAFIVSLFTPIVFLGSVYNKFMKLKNKEKKQPEQAGQQAA